MAELESVVADAIVSLIETNHPDLKSVSFDRVKIATDDFRDSDVPAVQLWDLAQITTHVRGYEQVDWQIALELVMKSTTLGVVDQKTLWEKRRAIELTLWDFPNLKIAGVIHLIKRSSITDMHLLEPFYVARIEFDVRMLRKLTGSC